MNRKTPTNPLYFIVIGNPISHSKSPDIHHAFARQLGLSVCYRRQFCPDNYDSFVAVVGAFFHGGGTGANVTLPFKEMAYELCQKSGFLSPHAKLAGAVNTLKIIDGKLFGDNTDGKGLVYDLQQILHTHNFGNLSNKKVLLLGAGGASRGVILPLLDAGVAHLSIANRTHEKAQALVKNFADKQNQLSVIAWENLAQTPNHSTAFDIVINATSATTTAQTLTLPNTLESHLAYDMAYGKTSSFLQFFDNQAVIADGLGMLVAQAAFAFESWTGISANDLDLADVKQQLLKPTSNIYI